MLNLLGFQGEIPRLESRMLPPTHAEEARNVKLESGALQPYRLPKEIEILPSIAQTIYKDGNDWLWWNAEVDVVPGPVATDRLYITGLGEPKVKVGADVYPLALPFPTSRPNTALRSNAEYLVIDGADVRLIHDKTVRSTSNAWTVDVSVSGDTATVTCTHAGATPAQAQNLVNGLRYRTGTTNAIPSLKVVRVTRVRDGGGQDYDENRNPLGSPTRTMQDVGTTVRVAGTTLTYDFPVADSQSSTNVTGVKATATLTLSSNAAVNDTITVGSRVYTMKASAATANEITIGGSASATAANIAAAINGTGGGSGTTAHASVEATSSGATVTATARFAGTSANSIDLAETGAAMSWSGGKMSGGINAQNDPPTFSTTGLDPVYANAGDAAVALFTSTSINTVESGQTIVLIEFEVEGLTNGAVDPDTFETYRHAYTYVTSLDEESAPSNLSRPLRWSPGQSARVSGFASPPGGRAINRIRIYRSQTGDTGQTDLYFVGEIPVGTTFFDDNLDDLVLGEPISTIDFDVPFDSLEGLTEMPNGMMAAFRGKEVFFCEPYKPHAWPRKYSFTVGWPIVGLASLGAALAILTTGQPTIAEGTHPENMRSRKLEVDLPCLSARSIVDFGYYVAYASHRGLVVLNASGARLVTEELLTREDWHDMNVDTFRCGQYAGRYVISHDPRGDDRRRCTIIDLTGKEPFLVRTSWKPRTFHYEVGRGRLYFLDSDRRTIREFDSLQGQHARMVWRSKLFVHPEPVCYSRILISAEKVAFRNSGAPSTLAVRIFADGEQIETLGLPNRVLPLPGGFMARKWQVVIAGTFKVHAVYMGMSPEEIAAVAQV